MKVFGLRSYANNDPVTMPFKKTFKINAHSMGQCTHFFDFMYQGKSARKNSIRETRGLLKFVLKRMAESKRALSVETFRHEGCTSRQKYHRS